MDECLPPVIRDSKWFMYPFFKVWFKNRNISEIMDFKRKVQHLNNEEFAELYRRTVSKSADRPTDINEASIEYMLKHTDPTAESMLDIGCGRGYWLNLVAEKLPSLELTGVDFYDDVPLKKGNYVRGNIENLPFPDKSFDVITCCHVIEHLQNLPKAIEEMKRVARKQIIIATPCQRYYYYTLDFHLHFFPTEYSVSGLFQLKHYECKKIDGDWLYIGRP